MQDCGGVWWGGPLLVCVISTRCRVSQSNFVLLFVTHSFLVYITHFVPVEFTVEMVDLR